ncbi:unnamed protein product [Effrenium voratum]|nr:unnamed protein product [Effrenium voratum]
MIARHAKLLALSVVVLWQFHLKPRGEEAFASARGVLQMRRLESVSRRADLGLVFKLVRNVNSASNLWAKAQKWQQISEKTEAKLLPIDTQGNATEQASKLVQDIAANSQFVIGTELEDLPEQVVSPTPFEILMVRLLCSNEAGLSAVHAEPGVGKSVAALAALPAGNISKNMTLLLSGSFRLRILQLTRANDLDLGVDIVQKLFSLLHARGIHINLVFDNSFEDRVDGDRLIKLAKKAFVCDHHIIVIAQSAMMACRIGNLNGARTRVAYDQAEVAADYRWNRSQAEQFLRYFLQETKQNLDKASFALAIQNSVYPDAYGGWKPVDIMVLLKSGQKPRLPSGRAAASKPVWVRQLQKDGEEFEIIGNAFQVKGVLTNVDDLKKAIKQENPNTVSCDAYQIDIYRQEEGGWVREDEEAAVNRGKSKADCYGFVLPA